MTKEQRFKIESAIGNMKLEGFILNEEEIKMMEKIVTSVNPQKTANKYIKQILSKYNEKYK